MAKFKITAEDLQGVKPSVNQPIVQSGLGMTTDTFQPLASSTSVEQKRTYSREDFPEGRPQQRDYQGDSYPLFQTQGPSVANKFSDLKLAAKDTLAESSSPGERLNAIIDYAKENNLTVEDIKFDPQYNNYKLKINGRIYKTDEPFSFSDFTDFGKAGRRIAQTGAEVLKILPSMKGASVGLAAGKNIISKALLSGAGAGVGQSIGSGTEQAASVIAGEAVDPTGMAIDVGTAALSEPLGMAAIAGGKKLARMVGVPGATRLPSQFRLDTPEFNQLQNNLEQELQDPENIAKYSLPDRIVPPQAGLVHPYFNPPQETASQFTRPQQQQVLMGQLLSSKDVAIPESAIYSKELKKLAEEQRFTSQISDEFAGQNKVVTERLIDFLQYSRPDIDKMLAETGTSQTGSVSMLSKVAQFTRRINETPNVIKKLEAQLNGLNSEIQALSKSPTVDTALINAKQMEFEQKMAQRQILTDRWVTGNQEQAANKMLKFINNQSDTKIKDLSEFHEAGFNKVLNDFFDPKVSTETTVAFFDKLKNVDERLPKAFVYTYLTRGLDDILETSIKNPNSTNAKGIISNTPGTLSHAFDEVNPTMFSPSTKAKLEKISEATDDKTLKQTISNWNKFLEYVEIGSQGRPKSIKYPSSARTEDDLSQLINVRANSSLGTAWNFLNAIENNNSRKALVDLLSAPVRVGDREAAENAIKVTNILHNKERYPNAEAVLRALSDLAAQKTADKAAEPLYYQEEVKKKVETEDPYFPTYQNIKKWEKFSPVSYEDSNKTKGIKNRSIGWGTGLAFLDENGRKILGSPEDFKAIYAGNKEITEEQANDLFKYTTNKIKEQTEDYMKGLPENVKNNKEIKSIVFQMIYQMGAKSVKAFPGFREGLSSGNLQKAANEMIYNYLPSGNIKGPTDWYKRTATRAKSLSDNMRNIELSGNTLLASGNLLPSSGNIR